MEDMLIARVKSVIVVRWTKGRQLSYQDHIVNFRQDITEIAAKLPRLPEDIDMILICKEDVDLSHHVDFTVRREKVKAALQYKITLMSPWHLYPPKTRSRVHFCAILSRTQPGESDIWSLHPHQFSWQCDQN